MRFVHKKKPNKKRTKHEQTKPTQIQHREDAFHCDCVSTHNQTRKEKQQQKYTYFTRWCSKLTAESILAAVCDVQETILIFESKSRQKEISE
jgi:hypothetical protein